MEKKGKKIHSLWQQQGYINFIQSILAAQRFCLDSDPVYQSFLTHLPCADSAHQRWRELIVYRQNGRENTDTFIISCTYLQKKN